MLRTLGKKAGALTFIGDVLKGLIAVLIAKMIAHFVNLDESYIRIAIKGHNENQLILKELKALISVFSPPSRVEIL